MTASFHCIASVLGHREVALTQTPLCAAMRRFYNCVVQGLEALGSQFGWCADWYDNNNASVETSGPRPSWHRSRAWRRAALGPRGTARRDSVSVVRLDSGDGGSLRANRWRLDLRAPRVGRHQAGLLRLLRAWRRAALRPVWHRSQRHGLTACQSMKGTHCFIKTLTVRWYSFTTPPSVRSCLTSR